ncbi:exodeoxyribonuclease 7 small subunit [Methylobacterium gregans]|uniref:Exodeoxyribonuclease 7 small subunit n=1 Tax=Methylobacterium gregans TaxID=374424 RepID=A0AA37MIV1_9HYPH|nr:exodeoxyribonuclease VII small subunit [Methylobacterium gregans]MDQ0523175.1 exodeoxyribonuclease VII small subunit [Methylobacterium gregans]GJD81961.1 Exodeoxyribonuclease 7 small subunit [Methylobacterium gregans]GLS57029.1 exodeoxyribonuclease 7 small subunit [Methylobacterium gregans]
MNAARSDTAPAAPDLPFEKALEQLEEIVRRLERGDVPLDESVAIYERGEMLKRHCEQLLKRAEARIQRITLGPDGRAEGVAPLDVE